MDALQDRIPLYNPPSPNITVRSKRTAAMLSWLDSICCFALEGAVHYAVNVACSLRTIHPLRWSDVRTIWIVRLAVIGNVAYFASVTRGKFIVNFQWAAMLS
jgi:hypothetical protein